MPAELAYDLNAEDRIAFVNEAWAEFASANGGASLAPSLVLQRPVWDFIADAPTRHIYRVLYDRVRASREPIRLAFRCDAPETRRLLELELAPDADGGVRCRVRSLAEQPREPLLLLDSTVPRGDEWIRMCSWCKRVAMPSGSWVRAEHAVSELRLFVDRLPPELTHGICGDCHGVILALMHGAPRATHDSVMEIL